MQQTGQLEPAGDVLKPRVAQTVPQSIYETLRRRIINFDLPPDTALSRKDLAEEFGVSLMPLREALQQLEQDGLVRIRPQSGTVVTRIDRTELAENQFLRIAVESEVVRRLAETPNEPVLRRAQAILDMQAVLVADLGQAEMFTELDRSFHRTLFEAVGMGALNAMVARRQGHLARCQRLELPRTGKMEAIVSAHRDILAAIAARDPQAATNAMCAHLNGTISRLQMICDEHPAFFSSGPA